MSRLCCAGPLRYGFGFHGGDACLCCFLPGSTASRRKRTRFDRKIYLIFWWCSSCLVREQHCLRTNFSRGEFRRAVTFVCCGRMEEEMPMVLFFFMSGETECPSLPLWKSSNHQL